MGKKYWNKRGGPEGPWDVIVIGSGMGGMACAALLTKLGKKVLVLEQHYTPGGFTHVFRRPGGYSWDVGVHAVGEVTPESFPGKVLEKLTEGRLEWSSLGEVYDWFSFPDDFTFGAPDTLRGYRERLLAAFPGQGEAIAEYMRLSSQLGAAFPRYVLCKALPPKLSRWLEPLLAGDVPKLLRRRTEQVLDDLTQDERLRAVLTSQWGYYGAPPSESSFAIQALVLQHFGHGGAFYPRGGSQRIAEELLRVVAEGGGWTRIATPVEEIVVEEDRATGVRLGNGEVLQAEHIVSAAGVQSTLQRLLPERYSSQPWAQEVLALEPAPCHVCLYLGFKGDIRQGGASAANRWFYESWDMEAACWEVSPDQAELPPAPVLYCSFPSLKDPDHEPGEELKHTGEVVTFVPWEMFEGWSQERWHHRGEEYEAFKERLKERLLAQFLEKMPELEEMLDYVEISTPASTQHFARPMKGSIYGIKPTPERFFARALRPHSPIEQLYFAGSEIVSVGVMGAFAGGLMAAFAVDPWGAAGFLARDLLRLVMAGPPEG